MVFQIAASNSTPIPSVSCQTVLGDSSSLLHVQPNQTFYIEYSQSDDRRSVPPVNFRIEQDGEIYLPADFRVIGEDDPPFDLDGRMSGVYNFTAADGKEIVVGPHAMNAQVNNGSYVDEPKQGIFHSFSIAFFLLKISICSSNRKAVGFKSP